jgi:predicted GIY-YIG superfamily endonuclease
MTVGIVYKVINSEDGKIYIGSTMQKKLSSRMGNHRERARKNLERKSKFYTHMREVGVEKFSIHVLVKVYDLDRDALEALEFKEIAKRNPTRLLNMNTVQGKRCKEHVDKVIKYGKDNGLFKRGSIFKNERIHSEGYLIRSIVFRWLTRNTENKSVQHERCWSIKKYGEMQAYAMAEIVRNEVYPL